MKTHIVAILALCAAFTGCASIVSGTSQVVSINSNVQGATVSINGNQVGSTPFTSSIPRGKDTTVTVSKKGYTSQTIVLSTKLETIFWGNIIFGGLIGSTTDFATGACWEYSPGSYYINLNPGVSATEFQKDSELKCYAMTHAAAIRAELAAGSGEHIDALYSAFFAAQTSRDAFLKDARAALLAAEDNAVSLGEKIAALRI